MAKTAAPKAAIEIKHRRTGKVLFRDEESKTMKAAVLKALASGADLRSAYLRGADLSGAKGIDANGKTTPLTDADYLEMRDEFRKKHPEIPIVPQLDLKICEVVNSGKGQLEMATWHSCKTSHCRFGWAIHFAGKEGYALEEKVNAQYAGAMIYMASTGRRPDCFASNEAALKDICEWGAKEATAQV